MTMNKKKLNNYSLIHVGSVVVLAIVLVTSTFAFPMGTLTSGSPLSNGDPYMPNHPGPEDGSTNVSIYEDLNWTGGDPDGDNVTYDVFYGPLSPPPKVVANQSYTHFDPWDVGQVNYSTLYYWKIIAWDDGNNSMQGPQWQYTTKDNVPPNTPNSPSPGNGSTNVNVTEKLTWTGGDPDNDPVTYDVYFGAILPLPKVSTNQSDETYDPVLMNSSTQYYWMIVAWDNQGTSATGPLWEFTTGVKPNTPPNKPSNPSPASGATGVSVSTILSWTAIDPDGDSVSYDVYFGTASNPPIVKHNQTTTSYTPGSLAYGTKYYWKIVVWDFMNASAVGDIWYFTTIQGTSLSVEITKPLENKLYFQDKESMGLMSNTVVYGPITITANVSSDSDVKYVLFYIDGTVKFNDTEAPYEYLWKPLIQFNGMSLKHTIKVVAVNDQGKNASDELNVTKWRFHPLPWIIAGVAIASGLILRTKITGWVYNLQESRFSCSFYAFSAFYKTTGPFRSARGVIKMKAVTGGKILGPTSMTRLGPFHKLAFGSFTFLGVPHYTSRSLGQGLLSNFLQPRESSILGNLLDRSS